MSRNPAPSTGWQEKIAADDEQRYAQYAQQFARLQARKSARWGTGRTLHRKQLTAASGTLEVLDDYPYWVGKKMGYFDGLETDMQPGPSDGTATVKFVDVGQADMGFPSPGVFSLALAQGIPLVSAPWNDVEGLFTPGEDFLAMLLEEPDGIEGAPFGIAAPHRGSR